MAERHESAQCWIGCKAGVVGAQRGHMSGHHSPPVQGLNGSLPNQVFRGDGVRTRDVQK